MTAVEEFGIAAVESQAAGRPVIARRGGGALETIVDGVTGCFWSGGPDELARAILAFDDGAVDARVSVRATRPSSTPRAFAPGDAPEMQAARAAGTRPSSGDRQPLACTRLMMRAWGHR